MAKKALTKHERRKMIADTVSDIILTHPPAKAASLIYTASKGPDYVVFLSLLTKVFDQGPKETQLVAEHLKTLMKQDIV